MTAELEGKVVAITGASSGIGEATALACARAGARGGARRAPRPTASRPRRADRGRGRPRRWRSRPTSPTRPRPAPSSRARAEQLGRLDVLVNNAGVMLLGAVEGADTEQWRRMIDVNCLGLLYCTHAALPLLKRNDGRCAATSSTSPRSPGASRSAGSAVYNMTKWGVGGFSEGLRQEVAAQRHPRDDHRARRGRDRAPEPQHRPRSQAIAEQAVRGHRERSRPRTSPTRSSTRSPSRSTSRSTRCSCGRRCRHAEVPSIVRPLRGPRLRDRAGAGRRPRV